MTTQGDPFKWDSGQAEVTPDPDVMLKSEYDTDDDSAVDEAEHAASADAAPWTGITGKPSTFPPETHSHPIADILDEDGAGSTLDADLLDGVQGADYARISVENVFTADQKVSKANPFISMAPAAQHGVIRAVVYKDGLADNTITEVFKVVTADESGSNDAGTYVCSMLALVSHTATPNPEAVATPAAKKHMASFTRSIRADGTNYGNSGIEDTFTGASSATTPATKDIGTITASTVASTVFDTRVRYQVDLSGSAIGTASIMVEVTLIWHGFLTPPVITAL